MVYFWLKIDQNWSKITRFFIVILLGYSYFIGIVYIRVGNIIDLLIDIIIKYPLLYFGIGDWWCMGGVYNMVYDVLCI